MKALQRINRDRPLVRHEVVRSRRNPEAGPRLGGADAFVLRPLALAIVGVLYAWLLTHSDFNPFGADNLGLTFNSMLDHMLRGRWDVDPATIGPEAFVHDGRSYAYFGPFPALLRLPLVVLPHWLLPDWRNLHVERISCWVAIMLGIAAQSDAITTALSASSSARKHLGPPLVFVCALSGPPMLLGWNGAQIYHEAILWAWALAMGFIALALPVVQRSRTASVRRSCAMALCAGLCLLTRSTTGAGLCMALGLLLLDGLRRGRDAGWRAAARPSFWAPACVLGVLVGVAGLVNLRRWGDPLVFANLRQQTLLIEVFPDRLARLQRHGLFDWHRLDLGLLYYIFPIWTPQLERLLPLRARLLDLYDAVEGPATSLLLTDPVWSLLSMLGVAAIVRRRASAGETLLVCGLSLAPALMLTAWYLAFRYRAEFAPLLLVLSCIGLNRFAPAVTPGKLRAATLALSLLCVLQVGSAFGTGISYARQLFGPSAGYSAISLRCVVTPASCVGERRPGVSNAPGDSASSGQIQTGG